MKVYRIECPTSMAEGRCNGIPFEMNVIDAQGGNIHFWIDDGDRDKLNAAIDVAKAHSAFDVVTYSDGSPQGFWAGAVLTA